MTIKVQIEFDNLSTEQHFVEVEFDPDFRTVNVAALDQVRKQLGDRLAEVRMMSARATDPNLLRMMLEFAQG